MEEKAQSSSIFDINVAAESFGVSIECKFAKSSCDDIITQLIDFDQKLSALSRKLQEDRHASILTDFSKADPIIQLFQKELETYSSYSSAINQAKYKLANDYNRLIEELPQILEEKKKELIRCYDNLQTNLNNNFEKLRAQCKPTIIQYKKLQGENYSTPVKDRSIKYKSPQSKGRSNQIEFDTDFKAMTANLESLIESPSKRDLKSFLPIDSFTIDGSFDSKIVMKREDLALISGWIEPKFNVKFTLLYRGSRDGFRAEEFHRRCDNHGATLVIARSDSGRVFGGFTEQVWSSPDQTQMILNLSDINTSKISLKKRAFLFSLNRREIYKPRTNVVCPLIVNSPIKGPCFGDGDLIIGDKCNESYCSSLLGNAYECKEYPPYRYGFLGGEQIFYVEEIEVHGVSVSGDNSYMFADESPDDSGLAAFGNPNSKFPTRVSPNKPNM